MNILQIPVSVLSVSWSSHSGDIRTVLTTEFAVKFIILQEDQTYTPTLRGNKFKYRHSLMGALREKLDFMT